MTFIIILYPSDLDFILVPYTIYYIIFPLCFVRVAFVGNSLFGHWHHDPSLHNVKVKDDFCNTTDNVH